MAQIRDTDTQRTFFLRAHHTLGRDAERSDTVVSSPITSRIHVALEWDGDQWNARDLSKNGTWLGNKRLISNESTPIARGDKLHLGAPEMPALEVVDDGPPQSTLVGLNGSDSLELASFVFLPDQNEPEAVVIYSFHRRAWMVHPMEQDSPQHLERMLHHGDRVGYGGREWQVFLAETEQMTEISTAPESSLEDIEFVFHLSQDEENTALELKFSGHKLDLGERSHHYLLLHLARLRADQAASGYDSLTQGWIDNEQLKRDLGLEMPHINIMIFRARKQIAETLTTTLDSELLVERSKGRVRFGGSRFRIYKGAALTHSMPGQQAQKQ
ncbi:FHA domain-containing protein [Mangrovimicrobium sediminis]|uniref:FHA domain-containing protein n=1 Tax=Mangrovimicrobium sediminis TaxID=2562682 RepID=A0A4Z0M741_9GAMM|nr:FHA domain-containing protein [Haliea sp. SAOS-164]TGD75314.1 FHA domain-containing protein [Haliea sp. SAOS-164]